MLCKDYDKSENDLKALQSVGQVNFLMEALLFLFMDNES